MTETALRISCGIFRFLLPILALAQVSAEPSAASHAPAERDIPIAPNGAVANAGWALGRLNKGGCMTNASFVYPETTTAVRLYLIDTGVNHVGTWFSANKNLKSFRTELVRGWNDPATSTAVAHGTQMLSLIAGPETGAALGTPIHVVNYNIYPGVEGSSTTSGRLADAVYEAIDDYSLNRSLRSVICIANGSSFPGAQSSILKGAIDAAVDAGITVVVSAGNEGASASSYIPAAYGTRAGVVCVGATGLNNEIWQNSNKGEVVDLFAPGQEVRTLNLAYPQPGSYQTATGTSPATALTAAAALIQLSLNPALTPEQVEDALTATAYAPVAARGGETTALVQVLPDPEGDSDLDGVSDIIESFFGSNPASSAVLPTPMSVVSVSGQTQLSFNIASDLFNPATPYVLTDGSTWKVRVSGNLQDWEDATGTLTQGAAAEGVIPMTFSVPNGSAKVFLQIDVTEPVAP
ncbi:MAG: hypothetical protein EOP83_19380 [Verrucomicrobiaceae bacterium]|nr:MAG: hypothetical protein EOP83_19380 [Verrucomicrobiaceae bacterium]